MRGLRPLVPWLLTLLLAPALATAADTDPIAALLARDPPPPGIVFEIVEGDANALERLIPKALGHIERLRRRFPELPLAVVTHGREQFALQRDAAAHHPGLHDAVRELTQSRDVPVHVCGTFAGWRGLGPEDFPDYVDVAPAGPAQIRDYEALGYVRVRLE